MQYLHQLGVVNMHALGVAILALVIFNIKSAIGQDRSLYLLMLSMIWVTVVSICADAASWLFNGLSNPSAYYIVYISSVVFYMTMPLIGISWYFISVYMANRQQAFIKKRLLFASAVYLLVIVMAVTNSHTKLLFFVDAQNTYQRGPLFFSFDIIVLIFLVLSLFRVYAHKADYVFETLASQYFWFPPVFGGIIQAFVYGLNFILVGIVISILMIYIGFQSKSTRLDYLTGIHNRRYCDSILQARTRERKFSLILIDIDKFKMINDTYGHTTGDMVLIDIAAMLRMSLGKNDFISRYGGDEFLIIPETADKYQLEELTRHIHQMIGQFNEDSAFPFVLSVSVGFDVMKAGQYRTPSGFLHHVDQLMYIEKRTKPPSLVLKQQDQISQ